MGAAAVLEPTAAPAPDLRVGKVLGAPISPLHLALAAAPRGTYSAPRHIQYLNRRLTPILLSDQSEFVLVEVSVRHGKSLFVSKWSTAWYKGTFPGHNVILTSYAGHLVKRFSRDARQVLREHGDRLFGVHVRQDSQAVNQWELAEGGLFVATSMGGQLTGVGGNLIVIDDPIKDAKEANNPRVRDEQWIWYTETLRTRLEPGGKIILVMARWHEDDLAGRVWAQQFIDPMADRWTRIRLPAIAEPLPEDEADPDYDPDEWRDEIGRKAGEPLWPDRYDLAALSKAKATVGPIGWLANFQQRPTGRDGDQFKTHLWGSVRAVPAGMRLVRRWDLGGESEGSDWTASTLMGLHKGKVYVLDVRRKHLSDAEKEAWVRETAIEDRGRWGKRIRYRLEQEPGSSGKTVAKRFISRVFAGFDAAALPTSGSKELNATGLAAQQQEGNVYLLESQREDGEWGPASWWADFKEEARVFPRGKNDDMIDTASQAYNDLVEWEDEDRKKRHKAKVRSVANRSTGPGQARPS